MHETTGTKETWEIQYGKIGMHPAYRNGVEVKNKARVIGVMPIDCGWAPGDRGFMAPMQGKSPGQGMLYLYPEHRLADWVEEVEDRSADDVRLFVVEETGRFGVYVQRKHPVAKAVYRAVKRNVFGHSKTRFHVNVNGDTMTIRVPERKDVKEYRPRGQRDPNQGRLL
ncbi:hypothetical protein [Roseobacter phage RDJL6]|nr:hypothetical protein [Roseobacter phage RDJL6]